MRSMGRRTAVLVLAVALVAGACGDDGDGEPAAGGPPATAGPGTSTTVGDVDEATDELPPLPERFAGHRSDVYGDATSWLCRPDVEDDPCDIDLTTTVVQADGSTEEVAVEADDEAPIDCFYVYPTVNLTGGGIDEAMAADTTAEDAVAAVQLARFAEVCRLWAPLYRQITLDGFGSPDMAANMATAYGDVLDAFSHYLANHNEGRPIVLIGHSQGTGHLVRLLADEFDGDEAMMARLVSALMIGGRTTTGADGGPGGSFEAIPACEAPEDTGCVVGYNAVGVGADEQILRQWGGAPAGERKLCTNPAALRGGPAPLQTIVQTDRAAEGLLAADTPFLQLDGALVGECVQRGEAYVLEVSAAPGWPAERLERLTTNVSFWGLHIVDVNIAQGDLIELVRAQAAAFAG